MVVKSVCTCQTLLLLCQAPLVRIVCDRAFRTGRVVKKSFMDMNDRLRLHMSVVGVGS